MMTGREFALTKVLLSVLLFSAFGCAAGASQPTGSPSTPAPEVEATADDSSAATEPPAANLPAGVSDNASWQPVTGALGDLPVVYVPGGCFNMGSTQDQIAEAEAACPEIYKNAPFPCDTGYYQSESPQHEVCLDAFWIGQMEVTNRQYAACMDAGVCAPPVDRTAFDNPEYADYPVIQVTWPDAKSYAAWVGGRLPTEAEWEYAARGPNGWVYPWGDAFEKDRLNYCDVNCDVYFWADTAFDDGYALASPVGTYPGGASWVGALDMSGNVWEWVSSLFKDYPYDAADGREDPDASGDHVLRGGAFDLSYLDERSAFRYVLPADGSCRGYGFRVAAGEEAVAAP